jgi:acyl-CoA thioesterase
LKAEDWTNSARSVVEALYNRDSASHALGISVDEVLPGRVVASMQVRTDMSNGHGICHGGFVFALADTAFALACNSFGESMVVAGASIEYLVPTEIGDRLVATATETSRVGRQGIYDVVVTNQAGRVIALFRGRCARLSSHRTQASGE